MLNDAAKTEKFTAGTDPARFLQKITDERLEKASIQLDVWRLDRFHPVVSGNKWFKLKYFLKKAMESGSRGLLSYGGAWSNHLVATAWAAKQAGLQSAGIVRGENSRGLTATLSEALEYGMELAFVPRSLFRAKEKEESFHAITEKFQGYLSIPEGGASLPGLLGASEMLQGLDTTPYSHFVLAIGTGTSFRGLSRSLEPWQELWGISVLKGFDTPPALPDTELFFPGHEKSRVMRDFHFGGYAKKTPELIQFMNDLYQRHGIPTDFVYTAKMFFGLFHMLEKKAFPRGSRILAIHSGGLQGNRSLPANTLVF